MDHKIEGFPPYDIIEEKFCSDFAFSDECAAEAKLIATAHQSHMELLKPIVTYNSQFGLVWRADFRIPDGVAEHVNRIILWRLPNGKLGKLLALNIDVSPL